MKKKNKTKIRHQPFILIAFFIMLTIVGITLGEPGRVLEQAIAICLSCIGIG